MLLSSGDTRADRRFDLAAALQGEGDGEAALSLLDQALEIAPGWPAAHFSRGEVLMGLDRMAEAAEAFTQTLRLDPEDRLGARLKLALLGAAPAPEAAPESFVRALFDQYAARFDRALVEKLRYDAPQVMARTIRQHCAPPFARVLDIGCGTGLMGAAIRTDCAWLVGVDLSPGMIGEAGRKGLYDQLSVGEAVRFLADPGPSFDLIAAADVVTYIGDAAPLFRAAAARLEAGGHLAFVTEKAADGWRLGEGHRYAHAPAYLRAEAEAAGLTVVVLEDASFRQDRGRPVPGLNVLLRRPAAGIVDAAAVLAAEEFGLPGTGGETLQ